MEDRSKEELLAELEAAKKRVAELESEVGAAVTGSGAVATHGGAAASTGAVAIAGDVVGNIYQGAVPEDEAGKIRIYREVLRCGYQYLPLRGLDVTACDVSCGTDKRLELARVYMALDTISAVERKEEEEERVERTRPLPALEAIVGHRHVVLLGAPGSGKSTFMNHLGLCLAMHGLQPGNGWLARLPAWPEEESDVLPVPVVLRDFAMNAGEGAQAEQPSVLWGFVVSRLEGQRLGFMEKPLEKALEAGKAIVLLDGLDEIPAKADRTKVRDAVAAFMRRYPKSRFVITCRTLSYQDARWRFESIRSFELAPFDRDKIHAFVDGWYEEQKRLGVVRAEDSAPLARQLKDSIEREDLWRLAPNPLLLTVMALVHTHKGRLPDARALLYEETIDILLYRWEGIKTQAEGGKSTIRALLDKAGRQEVDLRRLLSRLAYEAHALSKEGADEEGLADISELRLRKALEELHGEGGAGWAVEMIEAMKQRAGLLVERAPERFAFPHRTFQEYLAGAHLASRAEFAREAAGLLQEDSFWLEAVLLAVGRLVYLSGDIDKPLALAMELSCEDPATEENGWRRTWFAGEVLKEIGKERAPESRIGKMLMDTIPGHLATLLETGALSPVERASAGNTLARLGDPRFNEDLWFLPDDGMLGFVEVPAGPFTMGSAEGEGHEDERPQHELDLPRFFIAKYPVTVSQFRAFVKTSGYSEHRPESLEGFANHPVVHVTWHDAVAYCGWLTERLRESSRAPEPLSSLITDDAGDGRPWAILLPSEAQWEKAARGMADARRYPCGDELKPDYDNYSETGLAGTSPVGAFPKGASPYGCLDMVGNVWEWTRSIWGNELAKPEYGYPYDPMDGREDLTASDEVRRVLRGGAFHGPGSSARCSARGRYSPYLDVGFRVALSPYL